MAEPPTVRGRSQAHSGVDAARDAGRSILDLARAAAAGDERAIGRLYEQRFSQVFHAARTATGRDEHFCLDVVQETFLRILRAGPALKRLNDADHVERWLVRIAQSAALDLLRSERRRARRERLAAGSAQTRTLDEAIEHLNEQLSRLSPDDRTLLRLRSTGLTLGAIAEAVGTSIGAVHGRLRRLASGIRSAGKEHDHA
jgi:RNA polymerase sigma factor (sigma-70 family)